MGSSRVSSSRVGACGASMSARGVRTGGPSRSGVVVLVEDLLNLGLDFLHVC